MSASMLNPWIDKVKLHPDVEQDTLTEALFAVDLGAIAENDPQVPPVNRDPVAFFNATYLTKDLGRLLNEVLASLAGESGFDRVLKLRTPFGGGKSHTLATLLHAARSRKALSGIPEAKELPDPGPVCVAVVDGEKFDARDGKTLPDGKVIRTIWGWIAWQIDPKNAFPLVEGHDQDRVAPGGDVIKDLLTRGAGGRPVLILLDEMLKYMERAAAVPVQDSTLQRQAKDFFQNLTVEVAGSKKASLVYALTWSSREALGNVALLQEIDKLANRVDQLREPVSGDDIFHIIRRRLLAKAPSPDAALAAGTAYSELVTHMGQAYAESDAGKRQAQEEGLHLRDRMQMAYPFHPALIDLMRERWSSIDGFQRTRGSLRFLASCLQAAKKAKDAHPVLGPAEIPLQNVEVRVKLVKELGVQNDYDAVLTSDICGPTARVRKIDERIARETPEMSRVEPATRLATAIFAYSFGGLKRESGTGGDPLPAGVGEAELLAACVGPDLDSTTARAVLAELKNACLYLHYDGVRYCFKKDPNVTKLIEDAEQEVSRDPAAVRERIREMLGQKLAGKPEAILWPAKPQDLPDHEPRFLIGYLPLEFAEKSQKDQKKEGLEILSKRGDKTRSYRNGVCVAVPDKKQVEPLRRAVRYLIAIQRVEEQKKKHKLTQEQMDQLKERRRTEEAAAESAFRGLYNAVWLLRVDEESQLDAEIADVGGRPLQSTTIHERVMELLTVAGTPKVHGTLHPSKIIDRMRLGQPAEGGAPLVLGVKVAEVVGSFYSFLLPPRLQSADVIRKAIVRGIGEGTFGYYTGPAPSIGPEGTYAVSRDKVRLGCGISEDEVDLEGGFLMMPQAIPQLVVQPTPGGGTVTPPPGGTGGTGSGGTGVGEDEPKPGDTKVYRVTRRFVANRGQVYSAFNAIANLADSSDGGTVHISIEAASKAGFDRSWLQNAVDEPLEEADIKTE